jgi:hypothetical protein
LQIIFHKGDCAKIARSKSQRGQHFYNLRWLLSSSSCLWMPPLSARKLGLLGAYRGRGVHWCRHAARQPMDGAARLLRPLRPARLLLPPHHPAHLPPLRSTPTYLLISSASGGDDSKPPSSMAWRSSIPSAKAPSLHRRRGEARRMGGSGARPLTCFSSAGELWERAAPPLLLH